MRTRTSRRRAEPAARGAARLPARAAPAALLLFLAAAGAEIFRLGFFADDFHFLDVARRVPLLEALGGQYGIFPWYRPLSRELFFAGIAACGPLGAFVARLLSLGVVAGCTVLVDRLGRSWIGARGARLAAVLFATYGFTRFLMAWASGFQDLLALFLTLLALDARERGAFGPALLAAALAPFSKETAIVVFPLLAAADLLLGAPEGRARRLFALAGTLLAVVAVHALVRQAWHGGGTGATITFVPGALVAALLVVFRQFVGTSPVFEPLTAGLALVAAAAAALWLSSSPGGARGGVPPAGRALRSRVLLYVAIAVSFAPMVAGSVLKLTMPHPYYAFPAIPWLALLAGHALSLVRPAAIPTALVALLAGWNVLSLGYRAPDMGTLQGWRFTRWDWNEAVRLDVVSKRLTEDVRALVPPGRDSMVVLFGALPAGAFFQTEDGPATRVALGDPSVRSYWVNATPFGAPPGRTVLLEFDPVTLHLHTLGTADNDRARYAATSLASGNAGTAWAFAALGDSTTRAAFDDSYFRAGAALLARGPAAYRQALATFGLGDSASDAPRRISSGIDTGDAELRAAIEGVLRSPLSSATHLTLAHRFAALGGWVSAAVEYRLAGTLGPIDPAERWRFAATLERMGDPRTARAELAALTGAVRGTALEDSVRRRMAALDARGAAAPAPVRRVPIGRPIDPSPPPASRVF